MAPAIKLLMCIPGVLHSNLGHNFDGDFHGFPQLLYVNSGRIP
jgi:hypothetical protein